jgi:ribonuclease D
MTSKLPPPTLIEDQGALEELLEVLRGEPEIAVDTEADSFFSYREKVCLIQITAAGEDYLVDPLAKIDISGLGEVFADPQRCKIFHDGEYDVLILGREHGFRLANIFDTRIAATALGAENPGLASVLDEHFDIQLDKSMQRSNWGERPLSTKQIDYARLDTHYLHELKRRQEAELERMGRGMILEGECLRLEALDPVPLEFNPDEWVRLKGARALPPLVRRVVRELFVIRDELARESDVPPFRIMNNSALVEAAIRRPSTTQELAEIHGFSWRQVRRIGARIVAALRRGEELGPLDELPRLPPKDGTGGLDMIQVELFDRLKEWRRNCSRTEKFDASLILNRHALVRLVHEKPGSVEAMRAVDGMVDWQVERYGDQLLELIEDFERDVAAGRVVQGRRRNQRGPRGGGRRRS